VQIAVSFRENGVARKVYMSSGTVQVFKDIAPRQYLSIEEGRDRIEHQTFRRLKFAPAGGMGGMDLGIPVSCGPGK